MPHEDTHHFPNSLMSEAGASAAILAVCAEGDGGKGHEQGRRAALVCKDQGLRKQGIGFGIRSASCRSPPQKSRWLCEYLPIKLVKLTASLLSPGGVHLGCCHS